MDTTKRIASLVRNLRIEADLTQHDFAKLLNTSQSAVNRMEAGKQNFSMEMLDRMSNVLGRDLITVSDGSVNYRVHGSNELSGTITTRVSKNATVGLLCAALLNKQSTTLKHAPHIEEVKRIGEVLESIGVQTEWDGDDLVITPGRNLALDDMDQEAAARTRTIVMFLAALMHKKSKFTIPAPGGCKLGSRTIVPHLEVLEQFGLNVSASDGMFHCTVTPKQPGEVILYEVGDTVTENAIMAAAATPGKTVIKYASANYMVQDLCIFLQQFGVKIDGIGTTTLTVHGVPIKAFDKKVEYFPSEDPIESMAFIAAAALTKSTLTVARAPVAFLEKELMTLKHMGLRYSLSNHQKARNGYTDLVDITVEPSELIAPPVKIHALPYPGLNMDNLPFFAVLAASARGRTLLHDWSYENRAIYLTDLNKLGASTELADPHRLFINGPTTWKAADIVAPPALRPAMVLLIAMLAAPGSSILRNVYSISRGYESLAERLNDIGAQIEIF